ncbi:MAG: cupredoxin domain-containing protein [Nocardioidaceae bacterium]
MNAKRQILPALAAIALIGVAGCGSSGDDSGDQAAPSSATPQTSVQSSPTSGSPSTPSSSPESSSTSPSSTKVVITIKDFDYQGPESVSPGAQVTVMNEDDTTHTVTADDAGDFDVNVEGGDTVTFTAPSKPGSYPYHCEYHSSMHGTLVVK